VVLLIEPVRVGRRQAKVVRVLAILRVGIGQETRLDVPVSGAQLCARSVLSNTPPVEVAMYMCAGSRGSMVTWLSSGPSGVPKSAGTQSRYFGWSLKPATLSQLAPPSRLSNRPGGEVPAHQTPGSLAWPGSSQKV
jgi:hypothetical protein